MTTSKIADLFLALATEACNPEIESCADINNSGIRPSASALVALFFSYLGQAVAPLFAIIITTFGLGVDNFSDEVTIFFIPSIASLYFYQLPFFLTVIYFIFGADWLLVYWVDDLLKYVIEYYVSNISIFMIFLTTVITLQAFSDNQKTDGYIYTAIFFALISGFWEWVVLTSSVAAIRHVDPSWRKVNLGEILCPSLFYMLNICTYDYSEEEQA